MTRALTQKLIQAGQFVAESKGTTKLRIEQLPQEIGNLIGGLKTTGGDAVEITHRIKSNVKSPFCIFDIKVKGKDGLIDRIFASISDWSRDGRAYSVKWRKGSTAQGKAGLPGTTKKVPVNKPTDIKPPVDKSVNKVQQGVLFDNTKTPVDIPTAVTDKVKKGELLDNTKPLVDKPIDATKKVKDTKKPPVDKPTDVKPPVNPIIPGVLPPETRVIGAGLEPHPTQHIPNIRDFELDGLYDESMAKRLETITKLSKDGRQALFNPLTGKPNVFWTFNRNEALEYFLQLLGRK